MLGILCIDIRNIRPVVENHKNRKDCGVWYIDGARDAWIDAVRNEIVKQIGCDELYKVKKVWLATCILCRYFYQGKLPQEGGKSNRNS